MKFVSRGSTGYPTTAPQSRDQYLKAYRGRLWRFPADGTSINRHNVIETLPVKLVLWESQDYLALCRVLIQEDSTEIPRHRVIVMVRKVRVALLVFVYLRFTIHHVRNLLLFNI